MPKSAGGRWLVWACMRCNKAKGNMTPWHWAEFLDTCSFGHTPDPLAGRKTALAEVVDGLLEIGGGRARHDAFQEILVEERIEALVNEMLP